MAHRCILFRSFHLGNTAIALAQQMVPLGVLRRELLWSCGTCPSALCLRGFASSTGGPFSSSVRSHRARVTCAIDILPTTGSSASAQKVKVETLWREFFSDPSQWWDHRSEKSNPRYPDFKHKKTQQVLWLGNNLTPPWVRAELAAMAPGILQESIFSWDARLRRYGKPGSYERTLELFQQLQREGMNPGRCTFVPVLNACSKLQALEEGRRIHLQVIKSGFECDVYVANSLVDMYAKCGSIEDARTVFNKMSTKSVVSWNALILGYVKCGQGKEALELFLQMQREGVDLLPVTFIGVLNACASLGALKEGRHAHEQIVDRGYESDVYVATSLIDMYGKCGSIEDACRVFSKITIRNLVTCNAMILGYVKCGQGQKALKLFQQMQKEGVDLDPVTFVGVLNACASIAALEEGKRAHKQIRDRGYDSDIYVANSMVDMYAKCGSIEDARRVLNEMPTRNVVSWSAMLGGYSMHGYVKEALAHFGQMCNEVEVNAVSFVSLLSACSHGGLVDEGVSYFDSMTAIFSISPTLEHYACLVDLLGRSGHLHAAEDLIKAMPCKPNVLVWKALLSACRIHGNVEIGERVAKKLLGLAPESPTGYVLLADIYAAAWKWGRV